MKTLATVLLVAFGLFSMASLTGCGIDSDGDGEPDISDKCPLDPDKVVPGDCGCGIAEGTCSEDTDSDGDGTPDNADDCPMDPQKTQPGICGCGLVDTDSDTDGTADCKDDCPQDPNKTKPGECGCGVAEGTCSDPVDSDGDGTPDQDDGCPNDPNKIEEGICGCGKSDQDSDGDGTANCEDDCPQDPNKTEPGFCGCGVAEGTCDDDCVDTPGYSDAQGYTCSDWIGYDCATAAEDWGYNQQEEDDIIANCPVSCELCIPSDQCPEDPNKTEPGICGCGTSDQDSDGDGTADCQDNCPQDPNKTQPGACGCGVAEGTCGVSGVTCTLNPYAGVNWPSWKQYKANYHTHTTESDGSHSPAKTIDQYHSAGYSILAITDHNTITWPWTDYGRNPADLNMLAIRGDEYSSSDHINAFYNFSNSSSNLEKGIPHIQSKGGLCQINHPGRYNDPSDWAWYVNWYESYPACVGLEVINRADEYPTDKRLWDNINDNLYQSTGRFVWGYANDDKHGSGDLYRAFSFMLMPQLTEAEHIKAMKKGTSYFCSEPGGSGQAKVPRITNLVVDNSAKTITITANNYNSIKWIGPGTNNVGTGETFNFSNYKDKTFVRAVLEGDDGLCFTQPFGMGSN